MGETQREMLISHETSETRVALLEDGGLVELYVERPKRSVAGNVYLGKVKDVLPGMQAAFVDIGLDKNAFLYIDEIVAARRAHPGQRGDISSFVSPGDQVLVQVQRDPMGTKGARVTTDITLPGRFTVLMPFSDTVGVSRKLPDEERERLHLLIESALPEGIGGIVRTVAQGASDKDIAADLEFLLRLWKRVSHQAEEALAPEIVYAEMDLSLRLVRDVFSDGFKRLVIDDKATYAKVVSFLKKTSPQLVKRVVYHRDRVTSLFNAYRLGPTIDSALQRVVELPSGGYIAIDRTEALTAIDVNSGRYVGRKNLEDTILRINLEAAEEVARQLRLRDIGGIIVIDFIDMAEAASRSAVMKRFSAALERDRTKTRVLEMSRLGLVEMTRKNVTDGLFGVLTEVCPRCDGQGRVLSSVSRRIAVERRLRDILRESKSSALLFAVHPEVYELLTAPGANVIGALKSETRKQVEIVAEPDCRPLEIRVLIEGRAGLFKQGLGSFMRR
ncbi:MAG: Rne/Rng family ribonuclease [Coriobacteriia bacterium]|jgi:ribonuclease G|nr:Rne/Rng family ribonuclease [Coriobacteriia bacterium]